MNCDFKVGAINTTLLDNECLSVDAIDLLSRHERIQQRDFFDVPAKADYDLVVSSMVLNSVPTPDKRGEMLLGYNRHLRVGGHLCLMIPKSCLTHSKDGLNVQGFSDLLSRGLGFHIIMYRESPKVAFYFCRKDKEHDVFHLQSWDPRGGVNGKSHQANETGQSNQRRRGWQKDFGISFSGPSSKKKVRG